MRIWVYILICADDSFYVGSHRGADPVVREAEHNDGLDPVRVNIRASARATCLD